GPRRRGEFVVAARVPADFAHEGLVVAGHDGDGATVRRQRSHVDRCRLSRKAMTLFAGGHLPETDGAVGAAGEEGAAVGREQAAGHAIAGGHLHGPAFAPACQLPYADRAGAIRRRQGFAVRRERQQARIGRRGGEGMKLLAVGSIPDADAAVGPGGGGLLFVGGKRDVAGRGTARLWEPAARAGRGGGPDAESAVEQSGRERLAVGRKAQTRAVRALDDAEAFARGDIPERRAADAVR